LHAAAGDGGDDALRIDGTDAMVVGVGEEDVAGGIEADAVWER